MVIIEQFEYIYVDIKNNSFRKYDFFSVIYFENYLIDITSYARIEVLVKLCMFVVFLVLENKNLFFEIYELNLNFSLVIIIPLFKYVCYTL